MPEPLHWQGFVFGPERLERKPSLLTTCLIRQGFGSTFWSRFPVPRDKVLGCE